MPHGSFAKPHPPPLKNINTEVLVFLNEKLDARISIELTGKKPSFLKTNFTRSILKEIYALQYLVLQNINWCYVE